MVLLLWNKAVEISNPKYWFYLQRSTIFVRRLKLSNKRNFSLLLKNKSRPYFILCLLKVECIRNLAPCKGGGWILVLTHQTSIIWGRSLSNFLFLPFILSILSLFFRWLRTPLFVSRFLLHEPNQINHNLADFNSFTTTTKLVGLRW